MMAEKKIRVLIDSFHLYNALTGIRTYTTQLCEGLESAKNLYAEYIIYPDWKKLDRLTFFRGNIGMFKKILSHLVFFLWKQLILPIFIWVKKIDVVYSPDFVLPTIRPNTLGFAVIHDTFFWDLKSNYNPIWRPYFISMINLGLKKRSVIVATSHFTKTKIQKTLNNRIPIEVIYQSYKKFSMTKISRDFLTEFQIDYSPYFLHVGVFDKRKNIQTIINAFSKFIKKSINSEYKLVLVGERGLARNHDDFDNVVKLTKKLNIQENVIFPGFVSNEILASFYSNAHGYIFASTEEGFGIPVLEAMSFGIPVIVSDQEALREIAGDAALIFEQRNAEDLLYKMEILTDPVIRKDLIHKGKVRANVFSQERFAEQVDLAIKKHTSHS
jgi:glycosyltransferase involved in cell wall biosynthesis